MCHEHTRYTEVTYRLTPFEASILQRSLANTAVEDEEEGARMAAQSLLEQANDQLPEDWRGGEDCCLPKP